MISRAVLFPNNTIQTCRCACVWIPAQKMRWSLWIGCKRTWHIYILQCYRWHILWGWSRWTGPLCSGAFYRLFCWHSCIRGKDNRITKNSIQSLFTNSASWSRNQDLALLMELTRNPIWTCQNLLGHFHCPPRKTLQKLRPFCHTTELLHAAHWKSFGGNKWCCHGS